MVATELRVKLTYEDYLQTPDDARCELIDGELIMAPAPRTIHQKTVLKLANRLDTFVERHDLGEVYIAPTDVVLSDTDVVQPDLLFVSKDRAHIITDDNIQGAPDIVIEILSPSTAERDKTVKRDLYAKHGVKEYWQVSPDERSVTVLLLGDEGYEVVAVYREGQTLTSPTLAGFSLDVSEIF